jgi:hypothetical protein
MFSNIFMHGTDDGMHVQSQKAYTQMLTLLWVCENFSILQSQSSYWPYHTYQSFIRQSLNITDNKGEEVPVKCQHQLLVNGIYNPIKKFYRKHNLCKKLMQSAYVCMYVCMYVCVCVCMYVCMYVCVCIYIYTHTHIYICVCVCVCVYIHIHNVKLLQEIVIVSPNSYRGPAPCLHSRQFLTKGLYLFCNQANSFIDCTSICVSTSLYKLSKVNQCLL